MPYKFESEAIKYLSRIGALRLYLTVISCCFMCLSWKNMSSTSGSESWVVGVDEEEEDGLKKQLILDCIIKHPSNGDMQF